MLHHVHFDFQFSLSSLFMIIPGHPFFCFENNDDSSTMPGYLTTNSFTKKGFFSVFLFVLGVGFLYVHPAAAASAAKSMARALPSKANTIFHARNEKEALEVTAGSSLDPEV